MENRKIIEFENQIGMTSFNAIQMIKNSISGEIKELTFLEEYNNSSGHWGIKYTFKELLIMIQSDYGDINVIMVHNNKEISINELDEFMINVIVASRKNIEYLLFSLKRIINTLVLLS